VPHVPWIREQAALDLAGYYGMIENLDYNLGRIRDRLKALDLDRETMVVFFSDHGDMLGSHGQRGKSSPWEEAIRIPFVVGNVGGASRLRTGVTDALMNHVDIAPTTLGLCGIPVPGRMVGHDYSARCLPEQSTEPGLEPDSAFLQQIPRKLHRHSVNKQWRGVLMRDGWKYVCTPGSDWLLHDTANDPYEQANLAHDIVFQSQKERCHKRLARWIRETGDDFALPDIELPPSGS
jgi:arylsulfatase A-like enzyme